MGTVELESSTMIVGTFAIFFILCVNIGTLAAVALGKAQEHPNNPGKCYDPLTNVSKNVGAKWPLKNGCGRIMCEKLGNSLYLSYSTCPSIAGGDDLLAELYWVIILRLTQTAV